MVWYFNFCSPFLANDIGVNLNRKAMAGEIAFLMVFYLLLKLVYIFQTSSDESTSTNAVREGSDENSSSEKSSEKEEKVSDLDETNKKLKNAGDFNRSSLTDAETECKKSMCPIRKFRFCCVELDMTEVDNVMPVIFGHHAVAVAFSIMYSPYIYQTGMSLVYIIFMFFLILAMGKAWFRTAGFFWIMMILLNVSLLMSGVIGVGIANWDQTNNVCYGQEIYDN